MEVEDSTPLVPNHPAPAAAEATQSTHDSMVLDHDAIHVTIAETISAKMSREGALNSLEVKGDLQLRISDPSMTKVKLDLVANASHGAQFRTHPNVDRPLLQTLKQFK